MDTKRISMVSGAALLALTATASAGPMSVANSELIAPPQTQTEPVAYRYRHHYRHYGWHHRYYHRYYGWYPGAAVAGAAVGLATVPFALATGGYYYGYPYYYY
jgi:hypothetical protein